MDYTSPLVKAQQAHSDQPLLHLSNRRRPIIFSLWFYFKLISGIQGLFWKLANKGQMGPHFKKGGPPKLVPTVPWENRSDSSNQYCCQWCFQIFYFQKNSTYPGVNFFWASFDAATLIFLQHFFPNCRNPTRLRSRVNPGNYYPPKAKSRDMYSSRG